MKITKMIAALTVAVLLVGGTILSAQAQDKPCCGKKGDQPTCQHDGKGHGIPNLTDDQQKKMDALHLTMMRDKLTYKTQIQEKKAHLKTLAVAEQVDLVAINKTIDELYALKAELAKKEESLKQEVRKILTPEQRLHFDMMHNCGKGGGCHGAGAGCPQGGGKSCQPGGGAGCQQGGGKSCQPGGGAGCQQGGGNGGHQGAGAGCQQGAGKGCQHQGKACQQPKGEDK